MSSSKPNPHGPQFPVPPRGSAQSRFIPREELEGFAAWRPGALGPDRPRSPHPSGRPVDVPPPAVPAEPAPPTEAEWLEEVRHARDSGYQDGYRDGEAALEAIQAKLARESGAQVARLLAGLDEQWSRLEEQMAAAVTRTAVLLARQVVRQELGTHPELVAQVAREAIAAIVLSARHLTVRLNPADQPLVAAGAADLLEARDVRLVADAAIEPGGCLVESDLGQVDARIGTRWAAAAAVFGRDDAFDAADAAGDPA